LSVTNVSYVVDGGAPSGTAPAGLSLSGSSLTVDPANAAFDHLAVGASTVIVVGYDIEDAQGAIVHQTETITITGTNDGPVANTDGITTSEDTAVTFDVRTNDTDVDGDTLSVTQINGTAISVGSPVAISGGSISLGADGKLTYTPTADFNGTPSFTYTISDGHGGTSTATVNLTVTAVNDAPMATITPTTLTATEGVALDLKANGLSISDGDADGGSVTVTLSVGEGTFNATVGNSGVALSGNGTSLLTITGLVSQVNAFLGAIGSSSTLNYVNGSDTPTASTTLTLTVNDNGNSGAGGPLSSTDTATINITAVNDAPVNTIPVNFTTNEDTPVKLAGLVVSDADAGSDSITVTLTVGSGTLSAANAGGVTVTGSGTGSIVLSGSQADINAYLASSASQPTYIPVANANGSVSLTMTTSDLGHNGTGGTQVDTDLSTINITSVNDAPAGTNGTVTTIEDTTKILAASDFGFADPNDSPANAFAAVEIVTLPGAGVLKLDGVAVTAGQFISIADINAGKLAFVPQADVPGSTSLTFQVQDDGGTANGGVNIDPTANTLIINITPVNDAPVNTVPGAQTATAGTALSIAGISVFDSDNGSLVTTLSVGHGTLNVSSVAGLTITGNGTGTVQLSGDIFLINSALGGLSYTATSGYSGTDSLSVNTSDGSLSDLDSVGITVSGPAGVAPTDIVFTLAASTAALSGGGISSGTTLGSLSAVDADSASWAFTIGSVSGQLLPAVTVSPGSGGSVNLVTSGLISSGNYAFTVTATGSDGQSRTEIYTLSVGTTAGDGSGAFTITNVAPGDPNTGTDISFGLNGGDTILGGSGDDALVGGQNTDIINGQLGNDQLIGGPQNDIFIFDTTLNASTNVDKILDFDAGGAGGNGNDKIDLDDAIFAGIANSGASLAATDFAANAGGNATNGTQNILYDTTTGNLYYDPDGNGAAAKILFATLTTPNGTVDASDFIVI
jgi:Ca2+-binding RTX toxin-like protein